MLGQEKADHHQHKDCQDYVATPTAARFFFLPAHGSIDLHLLHILIVLNLPLLLQQPLALHNITSTIFLLSSLTLYNYFSSLALLALLMIISRLSKSSTDR